MNKEQTQKEKAKMIRAKSKTKAKAKTQTKASPTMLNVLGAITPTHAIDGNLL